MNRTRKTGLTLLLPCAVLALTMGQVQAETCDATASIDSATKALSAAKKAGGEWRLIDKSTGSASQPISKLLQAAKKKLKAGETDEACRIATKVAWAADIGLAQANSQANVKPIY